MMQEADGFRYTKSYYMIMIVCSDLLNKIKQFDLGILAN